MICSSLSNVINDLLLIIIIQCYHVGKCNEKKDRHRQFLYCLSKNVSEHTLFLHHSPTSLSLSHTLTHTGQTMTKFDLKL